MCAVPSRRKVGVATVAVGGTASLAVAVFTQFWVLTVVIGGMFLVGVLYFVFAATQERYPNVQCGTLSFRFDKGDGKDDRKDANKGDGKDAE
jgi:hypothetical protein